VKRILFIPDTHRPYHDHGAHKLMLKVGRRLFKGVAPKDRIVVILGDYADFAKVSFHTKNPLHRMSYADEVKDVNVGLDEIDELGAGRKVFVEGNHCFRLARHIADKTPEFYGLPGMTVPELFNLKTRGWEFVPYMNHIKIGKLYVTHEEGNAGPLAAQKARDTFEHNVVIGHNHTMASFYRGNAVGESRFGMSFGWLGDFKAKASRWQHGVGVGLMENNGNVHLHGVPFIEGKACVLSDMVSLSR